MESRKWNPSNKSLNFVLTHEELFGLLVHKRQIEFFLIRSIHTWQISHASHIIGQVFKESANSQV